MFLQGTVIVSSSHAQYTCHISNHERLFTVPKAKRWSQFHRFFLIQLCFVCLWSYSPPYWWRPVNTKRLGGTISHYSITTSLLIVKLKCLPYFLLPVTNVIGIISSFQKRICLYFWRKTWEIISSLSILTLKSFKWNI